MKVVILSFTQRPGLQASVVVRNLTGLKALEVLWFGVFTAAAFLSHTHVLLMLFNQPKDTMHAATNDISL